MTKASRRIQTICTAWNRVNPVGTQVHFYRTRRFNEQAIPTFTTSEACVGPDGATIMVKVDCMAEAVPVSQVKRRQVEAAE